eukprot:snap_masked-scaffold_8-processed-gene-4.38-mRNA-1 protein AED:1.00 eAED:1.00 QI:0/-1/0/0/-1/1/1/0/247
MSHIFKFDSEEKLRDETLQKFIKYTEEHNIRFSMDDIITFDVAKLSRINDARRLLPLFTHHLLHSVTCSTSYEVLRAFTDVTLALLMDIFLHSLFFILVLLFCSPYAWYCHYLYAFSFYQFEEEDAVFHYFRQNIIDTKKGLFIYFKELKVRFSYDLIYSPLINLLIWFNLVSKENNQYFLDLPEKVVFINLADFNYAEKKRRTLKKHILQIMDNNNNQFPITRDLMHIIEETRERFPMESDMGLAV